MGNLNLRPEPLDQPELYQRMIVKCSANADFKAKLLADTRSVLAAEGYILPEGKAIRLSNILKSH